MESIISFIPSDFGFFERPKLRIVLKNGRFDIEDYGCSSVDDVSPGVYAWTVIDADGKSIKPIYFGLYGRRAENPTLRNRFKQHKNGLNQSLRGAPPTEHWRLVTVPAVKNYLKDQGKIDIYFGKFNIDKIDELERNLIRQFPTSLLNSAGM